jgi:hypothetical protein
MGMAPEFERAMAAGAASDFAVQDPNAPNISNAIQDHGKKRCMEDAKDAWSRQREPSMSRLEWLNAHEAEWKRK